MSKSSEKKITGEHKFSSIFRTIILIIIVLILVIVIAASTPKSGRRNSGVWDERTTIGNLDAKNHYVMYTDAMCPYCDYFSRAIMSEQDDFEKYLADNDILFEVRITDFLKEYGVGDDLSTQSAEAIDCATDQNKFWDYYHNLLTALNDDYHSKGIGNAKGAPKIEGITDEYWYKVAEKSGVEMNRYKTCYNNHEMHDKVLEDTKKTATSMEQDGEGGMPYFKFNDFTTTGFDPSWGYSEVKEYYLDSGLKSQN